jgi:hypothetical protein
MTVIPNPPRIQQTSSTVGLTNQRSPTCTVGTVSLPPATARTAAAAAMSLRSGGAGRLRSKRFIGKVLVAYGRLRSASRGCGGPVAALGRR